MEPNNVSAPVTQPTSVHSLTGPIELLISAWQIFKSNWKILVPIAVTPSAIMLVGSLIGMIGGSAVFVTLVFSIASIVFSIVMAPTLIIAISKIEGGSAGSIEYWPQYKEGFKFFWIVLGLGILQGLIFMGSGILFIIPAIVVGVFVSFMVYSRVLDGNKGLSAFTESYSLVNGRWWAVFGRMLFLILIYIALAIILGIMASFVQVIFGKDSSVTTIFSMVLQLALSSTVGVLASAYIFKMFGSLKATRMTGVATDAFRKWLIAFLVIGIIGVIFLPVIGFMAFSSMSPTYDRGHLVNPIIQNLSATSSENHLPEGIQPQ